ncbi:hypothetical protein FE634_15320 [Nocardioides dongxiaopingii]|uniref:hypothetical protein n=1 Tax=Nocardioides sp. S-1144 TaxID=2582905 RepID=UPI00110DFAE8|nr:hypothetical protein [Nocardioides sp. S-1144]QCW51430.1 hypothetical protein FE634_15320 [Nocardioides sp. S-1144]
MVLAVATTVSSVLAGVVAGPAAATTEVASSPSPSWRVNGRVYAVEVVGDTVFVGGTFTTATSPGGQTQPRLNLAAFDVATGALRTTWRADTGAAVRAIVSDGTALYVGGAFGQVAGQPRSRLAKVSVATGALDQQFRPAVNDNVRALDLDATGIYLGGAFTLVNGVQRNRLAKVSADTGATDGSFVANANNAVWAVVKNPTSAVVYAAGQFSTVSGIGRNGVAAVSSTTGLVNGVTFASAARPTLGLAVNDAGTRLFGAGGTGENALSAWSTTSGTRLWRQVAMGDIQAVEEHDGTVFFGFHDGFQGDTTQKLRAADEATGVLDPTFRPRFDSFWGVFAIGVSDDVLVAGGEFTAVSGVPAQGLVRFAVTSDPPTTSTTFVGSTTRWRYWDNGTRPNGWEGVSHDDTAWRVGSAQLGYGDGDETTVVGSGLGPQRFVSTYFRAAFTASATPVAARLELLADDGAVVYLNGVEVVRDNMPGGQVDNSTRASSNRSGTAENAWRGFVVPAGLVVPGLNVVAVEVHQDSPSSSDLGFDLRLSGDVPGTR